MKVIILAGGTGTRLSEETAVKPKPMVEVGGYPIIWHIMKIYSYYGLKDFIICCGYKSEVLKEYFIKLNYLINDLQINLQNSSIKKITKNKLNWKIKFIDTGSNTMTGGRILRIKKHIKKNENFCLTYGDGLADINIKKLIQFHKSHNKKATICAVKPTGRYGIITMDKKKKIVRSFVEKPQGDYSYINGGFFVLNEKIFKYLNSDNDVWEQGPLKNLTNDNQLAYYEHNGFWKAMDNLNDKKILNEMWRINAAPWKIWKN